MRTVLSGLNLEGFPLSALAAYGLLRVLGERERPVRLFFQDARGRPVAVLEGIGEEEVVREVVAHLQNLDPLRYGLPQDGPLPRRFSAREVRERLWGNDPASPFLVAYVNPWVEEEVRSPLDTTSGQQSFLGMLRDLVDLLRDLSKTPEALEAAVHRALFQGVILPPDPLLQEEDPSHPLFGEEVPDLKWHRVRSRETATQAEVANEEDQSLALRLHPVALLLALEAFPFYPFPPGRSRLPLGFAQENLLLLPTPETLVGPEALAVLIALAPELADRVPFWASARVKEGRNDYPFFQEARPWPTPASTLPARTQTPGRSWRRGRR